MITLENVEKAAERLQGISVATPLEYNATFSNRYHANIYLKREDLQKVRSYKIRGAYNKIASLPLEEQQAGIVCASAGNHAQGVAFACKQLNIQGTIFMPVPTPNQKIQQVRTIGGNNVQIILTGDTFDDAKNEAMKYAETNKSTFIHPFDDLKVIEGQATIALELLAETSRFVDYVFVPVGGGGVAAGISSVFKQLSPATKIIGVEPAGAPSMTEAITLGKPIELAEIDKFVDGAAVRQVGEKTLELCRENLDGMLLADEGKVCETILDLYNLNAIVAEPAGALTLAALDQYKAEIEGKNVICLLSGGNNDITRMEEIKERALLYNGLKHYFLVRFPQRAGALKEFVTSVLGPQDDITHFEYIKKNAREKGFAVVGIELAEKTDFLGLINRMKERQFYGDYINNKESLMALLV